MPRPTSIEIGVPAGYPEAARRAQNPHPDGPSARRLRRDPRTGAALLVVAVTSAPGFPREGWGAKIVDRLARDLQAEFPGVEGFRSPQPALYAESRRAWPEPEILQQLIAKIALGP